MIHTDFDPEKTAVIEPSEFYHPMENMPEALIGVFSRPLTEKYAAEFHGEVIMQYQPDVVVCIRDYEALLSTDSNGCGVD